MVQDISVDISFNQTGGLSTLCFLEQVWLNLNHKVQKFQVTRYLINAVLLKGNQNNIKFKKCTIYYKLCSITLISLCATLLNFFF